MQYKLPLSSIHSDCHEFQKFSEPLSNFPEFLEPDLCNCPAWPASPILDQFVAFRQTTCCLGNLRWQHFTCFLKQKLRPNNKSWPNDKSMINSQGTTLILVLVFYKQFVWCGQCSADNWWSSQGSTIRDSLSENL